MDIFIHLIVWLIRGLVGDEKPRQTSLPRRQPGTPSPAARSGPVAQAPAQRGLSRSQPLVPTTRPRAQSPANDGERWRNVLTVLALALLAVMVAVWFAYIQGWVPGG